MYCKKFYVIHVVLMGPSSGGGVRVDCSPTDAGVPSLIPGVYWSFSALTHVLLSVILSL